METDKPTFNDVVITIKDFLSINLPPQKHYINPWLKENSITLISGWRGVGKTWLAISLLDAVVKGKPFGPWQCESPVPCLFLDGEMSANDLQERGRNLHFSDSKAPLYIYSSAWSNELGLARPHLTNRQWRQAIKNILINRKVRLVVFDNLASLASGIDENSKRDWDPINQFLLDLRFNGIASVLLHHTNKSGDQRGTSGREDNIDVSITLKKPQNYVAEDGARFIVHFNKSRSVSVKDLPLIQDMEFKLTTDDSGHATWITRNVKAETRREVLKMIDEGVDNKTICETLDITKGRISQIRKKALEDGHLTLKGSLTQPGYLLINE